MKNKSLENQYGSDTIRDSDSSHKEVFHGRSSRMNQKGMLGRRDSMHSLVLRDLTKNLKLQNRMKNLNARRPPPVNIQMISKYNENIIQDKLKNRVSLLGFGGLTWVVYFRETYWILNTILCMMTNR